jgi:putative ABC transport system substrate-binding protein
VHRRQAIAALVGLSGALAVVPQARSQPATPRRIGALATVRSTDPEIRSRVAVLEDELARLGWKKGSNLLIEYRFAEGDESRLVQLAKEILELEPELVVGFTESAAAAFRQLTLSVPIVFAQVPDPVAAGFVTNLARPEGNITGLTNFDHAIGAKWLQALKECAPKVNRVAIVFDPANPAWRAYIRAMEVGARSIAVRFHLSPPVPRRTWRWESPPSRVRLTVHW